MNIPIKKSIIDKMLMIAEDAESSIVKRFAKKLFGDDLTELFTQNALIHYKVLHDISVSDGGEEYTAEIQRRDGKNMYFSPADGWVAVADESIEVYKINYEWLMRVLMNALDIPDRCTPRLIFDEAIWALGQHRLERQMVHLLVARNLRDSSIFDSLSQYLNAHHNGLNPALVLSLDRAIRVGMRLPRQNVLVRLEESFLIESDNFELNAKVLAGKMGGSVGGSGFSNGYRTLTSNGVTYKFSKLQSEALEFMVSAERPMHQTEILSHTSSQQGDRLRDLFKIRGKVHPAWDAIIKNDGNGNYWLEY